jgi:hypothetical protein
MVGGDSASGPPSASCALTGAVDLAGGGDLTVACLAAPVAVALAAGGGLTVVGFAAPVAVALAAGGGLTVVGFDTPGAVALAAGGGLTVVGFAAPVAVAMAAGGGLIVVDFAAPAVAGLSFAGEGGIARASTAPILALSQEIAPVFAVPPFNSVAFRLFVVVALPPLLLPSLSFVPPSISRRILSRAANASQVAISSVAPGSWSASVSYTTLASSNVSSSSLSDAPCSGCLSRVM